MNQVKQVYSRRTRLASLTMVIALMCASTLVPAQVVRAQSAQAIEEIVVTARKREESLQEVPVVVNVLTEESINSQRIESIVDIATVVPGMVASQVTSGTSGIIYIRGIGTGSANPAFDQAVAINVDGMGINSAQLMSVGMFDLKQIEVLRGPQALFFGKNSPGGVIAVHTNDPGDEFELELTGMYETTAEETSLRGIISGPISDTLGARLAFGGSDSDDHWFDVYNEDAFVAGPTGPVQTAFKSNNIREENLFVLGTLLWEPTDDFTAKLKVARVEDKQTGPVGAVLQKAWCPSGTPYGIASFPPQVPHPGIEGCDGRDKLAISAGMNSELIGALNDGKFAGLDEGFSDRETDFASLTLNYEMENLSLTSVTGYFSNTDDRVADSAYEIASSLPNSALSFLDQWSQEIRVVSNFDGNVNFSAGFFYEDKEIGRENDVYGYANRYAPTFVPVAGNFTIPFLRQDAVSDGSSWSVFAQINWDINEQWILSVGGRYTDEEKAASIRLQPGGVWTDRPLADPTMDWNNFSPEVTLTHLFSNEIMFFASYKEGFKSGGHDLSFASDGAIYNEELVDGFEVGMKSTLLDGTMRFNVTAYSFGYEELQLAKFDGTTLSFSIINGGESSTDGLEIETFWITPVDGLTLTANLAFANSVFDEFFVPCWAGQTIAMGCTALPHPVTGNFTSVDKSGDNLPYGSDVSATLGLTYETQVNNNWNLGLSFNAIYTGDYNPMPEKPPEEILQDGFWRINAGVSLFSSDDKWEIFVRGVNLTDEIAYISGTVAPQQGNPALNGTNDSSGLGDFMTYPTGGRFVSAGLTFRL